VGKQALLVVYGGGLAGGGTATLIRESHAGFRELADTSDTRLINAWGGVNPLLPTPDIPFFLTAPTHEERHVQAAAFADMAMADLKGYERVIVYSFGYTSFMPYAFQKYIREGKAVFIWGDCSPPDTDVLGADMTSRFYEPAYEGTHGILYGWHEAMPKSRIPPNLASYRLTMMPFSDAYVENLKASREKDVQNVLRCLGLDDCSSLIIIGSSDIWSRSSIGRWMTEHQNTDARKDTSTLLCQLNRIAKRGNRIGVLIDPAAKEVMNGRAHTDSLRILPMHPPPIAYHDILCAADLVINRASHSVTSAECAAMGVPQIIVPMPRHGYMNVEDFTEDIMARQLALTAAQRESHPPNIIPSYLAHIAGQDRECARRAEREFNRMHTERNFFQCIGEFLRS